MRKDIVLGAMVSALILGSVFASSFFFPERIEIPATIKPPPTLPPPPKDHIEVELDDPANADDPADDRNQQESLTPVKAPDVPQPIPVGAQVQPLQPAPVGDPGDLVVNAIPTSPGRPGPRTGADIIDNSLLDRKPTPRAQIPPQYPFELRSAGIEGEVVVEFVVDTNGQVRNPVVVRSTQREFEAAALQAIAKWTFRPGRKGGRIVNAGRVQQLFTFRINE